jgi:hypothetical protein
VIPVDEMDADGDGFTVCSGNDCNDAQAEVYLGRPELCDGLDNNCNGNVDEGLDGDGDGYLLCTGDCADDDPTLNPGMAEICDGIDNDCDAAVDEGFDNDADGYTPCQGDCEDWEASVFPGQVEICDTWDTDCDGVLPVDEADVDGDGMAECAGDCDDEDAVRFPGNVEACDGIDNDCDGVVPADEPDEDADGFRICEGDCDDADPFLWPGATEMCDGVDNDCDGVVPANEVDADGDGWMICAGDCGDINPAAYPGAEEIIDGADNNCDGFFDNFPPVAEADATPQPFYICDVLTLDASGSSSPAPTGAITGWLWEVQASPAASTIDTSSIADPTAEITEVTPDVMGWYAFGLEVTDDIGATASDGVILEVGPPPDDQPPVADVGPDLVFVDTVVCTADAYGNYVCPDCPTASATLDGTASTDLEGDPINYLWTVLSGTGTPTPPDAATATLSLAGATAAFGVPTTTTWEVELVTSGTCDALSSSDTLTITYECTGS